MQPVYPKPQTLVCNKKVRCDNKRSEILFQGGKYEKDSLFIFFFQGGNYEKDSLIIFFSKEENTKKKTSHLW